MYQRIIDLGRMSPMEIKVKIKFLPSTILALMIVAAFDSIIFTHSGRAQGRITMEMTLEGVKSEPIKNLRITVVYDNNPYKAVLLRGTKVYRH
jgi:hypothetical protein